MNGYSMNPPPRSNSTFGPFDTSFPLPPPMFPSHDDPSRRRNNNSSSNNFDLFPNPSLQQPLPPLQNPYTDPYGSYRHNNNQNNMMPFPPSGNPGYPPGGPSSSTTSTSSRKRKGNHNQQNNNYSTMFPPMSQIGSPVSGASFITNPMPPFEPPRKASKKNGKTGKKARQSANGGGKKKKESGSGEGKKMRRRRDVDWRVRNDEQAYQKVLRNRQAAARSNEKRRRVRQQYDNEIGGLLEQKANLARRERDLKEENRRLRARMGFMGGSGGGKRRH